MKNLKIFSLLLLILVSKSFKETKKDDSSNAEISVANGTAFNPSLEASNFDTIIDSKSVKLYWLKIDDIKLAITNYGGRFVGLWVLDKNEQFVDVVVGFNTVDVI